MPKSYKIGYKKPPKHTQFQPGQSGNPKGKPKGTKNLKTDLQEELGEMIQLMEQGKPKKVSKQRAMVKALMAKAVNGDIRAANTLLNMMLRLIGNEDEAQATDLSAEDQAILDDFINRLDQQGKKGKENGK